VGSASADMTRDSRSAAIVPLAIVPFLVFNCSVEHKARATGR
jgi:hypothetical protein